MASKKLIMSATLLSRTLGRIAHQISEKNEATRDVVLIGIQRGGVHLASRLSVALEKLWEHTVPVGQLDVSMHRDDIDQRIPASIQPTVLPFHLDGKVVVLVDDVLFSGRTIRAAMDALNDFGRPRAIQLAVLIDRGHRQLPIRPDFVGKELPTSLQERVEVLLKESDSEDAVYLA